MENNYIQTFGWFFAAERWWLRHLLFWCYRYSEPLLGNLGILDDFPVDWEQFIVLNLMPDLLLVYLNLLLLIPFLLLRKRITWYIVASIGAVLAYSGFTFFVEPMLEEGVSPLTTFFINDFSDGVELFLMSTGLRVLLEFLYASSRLQVLRNEKLQAELAFLKSQINPHFLFNTLNNIATLSEIYPERVSPTVIQLSKVLRYQLYESDKEQVLLTREIENLRNYLDLEGIRQNDLNIQWYTQGNLSGVTVAPLLFLPFLENALKHSADPNNTTHIKVIFSMENEVLTFVCENSKPLVAPQHVDGGIGLKNIQRRLELLYSYRHELRVQNLPDLFRIELLIKTDA